MRRYETIVIVRPNVTEDDIDAIIDRTGSIIEADGGAVIKVDKWGLKKLAYLIKKEAQGYYIYIDYGSIPASVTEMERIFRIDDKVLKYLTVKLADTCDPEAAKEELAKEAAKAPAEETTVEQDAAAVTDAPAEENDAAKAPVEEATVEQDAAAVTEAPAEENEGVKADTADNEQTD